MIEVEDALGQRIRMRAPAARVVSLVPSETVSVADLAGVARVVGRTDYCVEPVGDIEAVPSVGG
ncbi:MAG: ABC transporter substrate-binding protein, partial [Polyangiales bacterium]